MSIKPEKWRQLNRKTIFDTKFLKVFEDTVELPSGDVYDDYTVVSLISGVIIVATDIDDNLITFFEYKHAINEVVLTLPSGGIDEGHSVLETAAKELLEETGYVSEELELVKTLREYPSKLDHIIHVVRAKNAKKVQEVEHESTESIGEVRLIPANAKNISELFEASAAIAALALTIPGLLKTS